MKYIKLFEQMNEFCWKVPTKDEKLYRVALDKIGMSDDDIDSWLGIIKPGDYDSVLYFYDNGVWSWSGVDAKDIYGSKYINKGNYKGEVIITPEDIEKWELEQNMKKYNL